MDLETLRWFASITAMIAACVVAANIAARITGWGFVVFLGSSVAWVAIGALDDDPALMWQNIVLTGINLFGIWRWLIVGRPPEPVLKDDADPGAQTE